MRPAALAALAALLLTTACPGEEDPPVTGDCTEGATRACYGGPEATAGVGTCRQGTETCSAGAWGTCVGEIRPHDESCDGDDNDCDGTTDEGVSNACGGCGTLVAAPGDACANCGTWACASETRLDCLPPVNVPGTACTGIDGCAGAYQCGQDGRVSCASEPKNACGVCGGAVVTGLNTACSSADGCPGTTVCNGSGTGAVCNAPSKNECGVCGGAPVDGLAQACASLDGCSGLTACNAAGDAAVCNAPSKNQCEVCAAPVTGLGVACAATGGCQGTTVCDATGTGTVCQAPDSNACGVCGAADPANLGAACTNAAGCAGILICDAAGTGTVCNATAANECGICGGVAVTGIGTACVDARGCSGQRACDAAGTGTVCNAPSCSNGGLLISEVSGTNTSATDPAVSETTDEFIELFNSSNVTIDISGATVWYRSATGTIPPTLLLTFPTGTLVQAGHYVLLGKRPGLGGSPGYLGPPAADFIYTLADISGSTSGGGQVWLTSSSLTPAAPTDATVIDMLGWNTANVFEGTGAAPQHPPLGGSLERKASAASTGWDGTTGHGTMGPGGSEANAGNGYDTDQNATDFVQRQLRDPQNSQSPAE